MFVAPNQIHFDTVFDDLDTKLADNYAVLVTLVVAVVLYVVGVVWARRMDRKDVEKVRGRGRGRGEERWLSSVNEIWGWNGFVDGDGALCDINLTFLEHV